MGLTGRKMSLLLMMIEGTAIAAGDDCGTMIRKNKCQDSETE